MNAAFEIALPTKDDLPGIGELYRAVAGVEGGLARTRDEITDDYIRHNFAASRDRGVEFLATIGGEIVGEIHAYRPTPRVFAHVLSDLTVAVHPDHQGLGIGRALFARLLATVEHEALGVTRIELIARESNQRAIRLYESLGFRIEGRFEGRIRGVTGSLEADIPMAWIRGRRGVGHP
ncbi:MAG TPA: GNAT family N-acetyltransferase [Verrucomicrobiota bacterium]|nr:GNAT family N-acetyltransferase [Verrucomicrobiales bacterium]HRI14843.1 GNAT family N-acetyltransferase [Verrucomicrobiota bacterium]